MPEAFQRESSNGAALSHWLTDAGEGSVGSAGAMKLLGVTGEPESAGKGSYAVELVVENVCFGGLPGGTGSM